MIKPKLVPVINFLDVINEAGGSQGAGEPLWEEIMGHWHGNQRFTNDSLYIYVLPSFNGEPLLEVQQRIADICAEAIINHTIVFDVSW